jgi:hypothetical protein
MTNEERQAWDRYAAAALAVHLSEQPSAWKTAAIRAASAADELIRHRRDRIVEGKPNE